MRGINRTREVLRNEQGGIRDAKIQEFVEKKIFDSAKGYLGSHI